MPAFFLSLLAAVFLTAGARDQRLMAQLSERSDNSLLILFVGWMATTIVASVAAVGAMLIGPMLAPNAQLMFLAIALLLAAVELLWNREETAPREPTRSLFAIAVVLLWRQGTDSARFVLLGIAVLTGSPVLVAVGGALGGAAALSFAWSVAGRYDALLPWRAIRITLGIVLIVLAAVFAVQARGIL